MGHSRLGLFSQSQHELWSFQALALDIVEGAQACYKDPTWPDPEFP